jgi:hypothetical protein
MPAVGLSSAQQRIVERWQSNRVLIDDLADHLRKRINRALDITELRRCIELHATIYPPMSSQFFANLSLSTIEQVAERVYAVRYGTAADSALLDEWAANEYRRRA